MITRFFSGEKLDLDIPGAVGRKYVGKLGGKGLVEVPKPIWKVLDKNSKLQTPNSKLQTPNRPY